MIVSVLLNLLGLRGAGAGALSLATLVGVTVIVFKSMDKKAGMVPPPSSTMSNTHDLGVGLWQSPAGWEIVSVLHDEANDLFYFRTGDGHVYGDKVGGYARNELATLYLTEKLSLSPANLFMIDPSLSVSMAVIRNVHGQPVMTEPNPQDGAETLLSDPAFHA